MTTTMTAPARTRKGLNRPERALVRRWAGDTPRRGVRDRLMGRFGTLSAINSILRGYYVYVAPHEQSLLAACRMDETLLPRLVDYARNLRPNRIPEVERLRKQKYNKKGVTQ